jgi:tripartite-type tricarboxylate transporter receptor subunit TctC
VYWSCILRFLAKDVPEFIAYAKGNRAKINMASGGIGSSQHIYGELFKTMTGVNMVHVPYRGGGPALADLLAGRAPVMFDKIATSLAQIRAGKLLALAVTAAERSEALPNVPTIGELVPGYEATGWQGIGAPQNTPPSILDRLHVEINVCLDNPKLRARITELGYTLFGSLRAEFTQFVAESTEKWARVIRAANIRVE